MKREVVNKYAKFNDNSGYIAKFCKNTCCKFLLKKLPEDLKLNGIHDITLNEPEEPSNLKWENLDATPKELFLRKVIVTLIVIGLMVGNFFIIMMANSFYYSKNKCPDNVTS